MPFKPLLKSGEVVTKSWIIHCWSSWSIASNLVLQGQNDHYPPTTVKGGGAGGNLPKPSIPPPPQSNNYSWNKVFSPSSVCTSFLAADNMPIQSTYKVGVHGQNYGCSPPPPPPPGPTTKPLDETLTTRRGWGGWGNNLLQMSDVLGGYAEVKFPFLACTYASKW